MDDRTQKSVSARIVIRSYGKAWKIENRIYAVGNIILPIPINPREILYFSITAVYVYIVGAIFPPLKYIPATLRYVLVPLALTRILEKKKFDGKTPPRYFVSFVKHLTSRKKFTERFRSYDTKQNEKIKLDWWCSYVQMPDRLR
jgi:hypothetical protein